MKTLESPVAEVLKQARIEAIKKLKLPDYKNYAVRKDLVNGKIILSRKKESKNG